MDESWRTWMGTSTDLSRRKSTEDTSMATSKASLFFRPDDFSDVFGGPPQTLLSRKFSGDNVSPSFYEEVFRRPEFDCRESKGGRSLPAFRIPPRKSGFYNDIFGSDEDVHRSRERSRPNSKDKSKSNSSSILSSEELSPCRLVTGDDVALSSFASKLRPINIPYRWSSGGMKQEEQQWRQPDMRPFHESHSSSNMEDPINRDNFRSSYYFGFLRRGSSPETMSLEPNSYPFVKMSADDSRRDSPPSLASSVCQEAKQRTGEEDCEAEEDEDEVMSSYVIEINSDYREHSGEAVCIDEAIAWAKETYQRRRSEGKESGNNCFEAEGWSDEHEMAGETEGHKTEEGNPWKAGEKEKSDEQMETAHLDEEIKLWSSGKETNIRLLLSTLHHILWPNSGWQPFPMTNLIESSQVKKAYQKAMLCLHPDKLQQRGATPAQKYVAEKAFSILQDAWNASTSQLLQLAAQ